MFSFSGTGLERHDCSTESSSFSDGVKEKRIIWTRNDDQKLKLYYDQLINKFADKGMWLEVAKRFPGRSNEQCRKRWKYKLDPNLKRNDWSQDEDATLLKLQANFGNKWTKIGKVINNRSDIDIKNVGDPFY